MIDSRSCNIQKIASPFITGIFSGQIIVYQLLNPYVRFRCSEIESMLLNLTFIDHIQYVIDKLIVYFIHHTTPHLSLFIYHFKWKTSHLGSASENMVQPKYKTHNTINPTMSKSGIALVFSKAYTHALTLMQDGIIEILSKYDISLSTKFGDSSVPPHLTLVKELHDAQNRGEIKALLQLERTAQHSLRFSPEIHYQPEGWLYLNAEPADQVHALHERCADVCKQFMRPSDDLAPCLTPEEAEMVNQYGYRYMYKAYTIPHITMGRVSDVTAFKEHEESIKREIDEEMARILREYNLSYDNFEVTGLIHYSQRTDSTHEERCLEFVALSPLLITLGCFLQSLSKHI